MIPIKLQLHNFLSYCEPQPLDFRSFNLAVLSGANGVGKSSILEAMTWAVWGQTRAASDDELIHQGQQSMWVEFVFEHENDLYRIVRKREVKKKAGQSFLEFQTRSGKKNLLDDESWQSIAEATLKATQEKIVHILKIPYEIFVNSSYLRQGHADEFTIKTPSERKEILSEVLELNFYEELALKAREKTRQEEEKIKLLSFQIEDLSAQIAQKDETKTELKKIQKEIAVKTDTLKKLKVAMTDLEKQNQNFEVTNEKLKFLRDQFMNLQKEGQTITSQKEKLDRDQKEYEERLKNRGKIIKSFNELLKLEEEYETQNEKFRRQSAILQNLKGLQQLEEKLNDDVDRIGRISVCPLCRRSIKNQEAKAITKHLQLEFTKKYGQNLKKFEEEIKQLNYSSDYHEEIQQKIKRLSDIRNEKQALDLAANDLKNIQDNLKSLDERYSRIEKEALKIGHEGKILKEKLPKLEKAKALWEVKTFEVENLNTTIMSDQTRFGALKQTLDQIEKEEAERQSLEKKKTLCQEEIQNFEELALAFGKKGIQAMIIETSLATIEENANELLGKITDGRMSLKFITQKAKKSSTEENELIETLEIKIADELGNRDYEMYSGGEAFRINFAIRIALSKLLASRAGTHLKFLAIDEGFGMLDTAGRDDLVAAINSIANEFEKILVITHLQELKDLFPTKIEVTKNEHGSQIEVTA